MNVYGNEDGVPAQDGTHLTVRQVDPDDLLLFPETAEGLIAQVGVRLDPIGCRTHPGAQYGPFGADALVLPNESC